MDAYGVEVDAVKQSGHIGVVLYVAGFKAQRRGTTFEGVEGSGVAFGQVITADVLSHFPAVVVGVLSAIVWFLARVAIKIFKTFKVFSAIVRLYVKPFNGVPHQFFVVVGTFEIFVDHFLPFLGGYRREFVEQFIVFHYVVLFVCLLYKKQIYKINHNFFFFL